MRNTNIFDLIHSRTCRANHIELCLPFDPQNVFLQILARFL